MLLKIFVKRERGGDYVPTSDLQYKQWLFEGDEILSHPLYTVGYSQTSEFVRGFSFLVKADGKEPKFVDMVIDTQGYEILNDKGVSIEKYVTPYMPTQD